jgi:hypothetical protein
MRNKIIVTIVVLFISTICFSQQVIKRDVEIQKLTPVLNLNGLSGVIQFYSGDVSIVHSTDQIEVIGGTFKTGTLKIGNTTLEIDSASIVDGRITFYSAGDTLSAHLNDDEFIDIEDVPIIPLISTGTSAPSSTPSKVGDMYIDTSAQKLYIATGTSSSSDWTITN